MFRIFIKISQSPSILDFFHQRNDGLMKILVLLPQMHVALPLLCDLSHSLVLLMPREDQGKAMGPRPSQDT